MASKRRVFQVAKEFNISNDALISYLAKLDFPVKTHMSPITDEMYEELSRKYKRDAVSAVDAEVDFRKRLKEKKAEEEKRNLRKQMELEERIRMAQEIVRQPIRKRTEPSREEVLKIAEAEAKAEAEAELRSGKGGRPAPDRDTYLPDGPPDEMDGRAAHVKTEEPAKPEDKKTDSEPPAESEPPAKDPLTSTPQVGQVMTPEQLAALEGRKPSRKKAKKGQDKKEEKPKTTSNGAVPEPEAAPAADGRKRKKRRKKKRQISEEEISASIKQTMAAMDAGKSRKRKKRVRTTEEGVVEEEGNVIKVSEFISAADLATLMDVEPADVLRKCLELGMMVSINQRLEMDTIVAVADEFGFDVEQEEEFGSVLLEEDDVEDDPADLKPRPPVVTIMGHVDHGKTSLLDYIRTSEITAGESGGITQHIGAYEVHVGDREICFLDTPGHEAFTAMRARGAQVTDIVILIVAADDGVQLQTVEAINHAKAAGVPIVVAINKIDRPSANVDKIKQELSQHGLMVEDWGGKHQSVNISAKTGEGIEKLLESVLLESDVLELQANPDRLARGTVIESELDRGKGAIATILVQTGTLKVGDNYVAGLTSGKVRAMFDERGKRVKKAGPSTPVRVVGFSNVPQAGDRFVVMESEKETRDISAKRQQLRREQDLRKVRRRTLDQISKQIAEGEVRELRVIVKADVDGSVEALADSLHKLSTDEVAVDVIHKGVGGVSEHDVYLAVASEAIIIGFHVRVSQGARELSKKEDIEIRSYKVIYDAVNDIKTALEGLLAPEIKEEVSATVEVRETFKVPKAGMIAGCYVSSGKVKRSDTVRIYRDDKQVYEGKISSLRRFKDDVREVASGFECGIGVENFNDIHVGDIIECIQTSEVKRTLD